MVFLDFVVAGLLLGLVLGGSFASLAGLCIRSLWLAYAAIALQVAGFPSGMFPWSTPDIVARVLWLVSYALLAVLVLRNRRVPGIVVVGIGQASNLIAILANRGLMPVRRTALDAAGISYHLHNNSISAAHPHVAWLIDRWAVPGWLPLGNVYSIGDIIIGIGVLVTLVVAMRPPLMARISAGLILPSRP